VDVTERDTDTLTDEEIRTTGAAGEPRLSGDDDATDADTDTDTTDDADDMDADADDADA
jgi:hypothetical protein